MLIRVNRMLVVELWKRYVWMKLKIGWRRDNRFRIRLIGKYLVWNLSIIVILK